MADKLLDDLEDELTGLEPDELDDISQQIRELAEEKRRQEQVTEEDGDEEEEKRESAVDSHGDEMPKDVPAKASLTVKTTNDNEYHYWQWRQGEKILSKYKGPKK